MTVRKEKPGFTKGYGTKGSEIMTELEKVKELIKESNSIAVLGGIQIETEAGMNGVRAEHLAYETEEKYGYSPEEIVTPTFLSKRVDTFYKYYKEVILDREKMVPTGAHKALAKLDAQGKISKITTRSVYGLYIKAGVKNVISLHGTVNLNSCPRCGKIYDAYYILDAKGTPRCEDCQVFLRPGFSLFGEMIDNGKISDCANAIASSDMLLVVGAALTSPLCRYMLKYYEGNKLVLISNKPAPGNERANYALYGNCSEIMEKLVD